MKPAYRTTLLRVLSLLAVIGISLWIFSIRDRASEFAAYGYPGLFIIAFLANATVLLPAPGVAVVFAMGGIFNPMLVALAAGTGGALGEMVGYLAGYSGQGVIESMAIYERIIPYVKKYGGLGIFGLAAIPNPFFDLAGIAAGALKIPLRTFFVAVWLGQLIKMALFAYAGAYSIDWLLKYLK